MTGQNPAVIVIGTGRSGSSTIAQVLHEDIGICMGHYLQHRESNAMGGQYEDVHAHSLNRMVVGGEMIVEDWLKYTRQQHEDRLCEAWGVKDHWMTYWTIEALQWLKPSLIIWARRPIVETIDSWMALKLRVHQRDNDGRDPPLEAEVPLRRTFKKICSERHDKAQKIHDSDLPSVAIDMTSARRVPSAEIKSRIEEAFTMQPK